mmetsp:Transcript_54923/g.152319  ORF Transcript_54923/g.152319 Transcript_54923/m.152319 type:complete len:240 (+) Transcript_54923:832-1551(+)
MPTGCRRNCCSPGRAARAATGNPPTRAEVACASCPSSSSPFPFAGAHRGIQIRICITSAASRCCWKHLRSSASRRAVRGRTSRCSGTFPAYTRARARRSRTHCSTWPKAACNWSMDTTSPLSGSSRQCRPVRNRWTRTGTSSPRSVGRADAWHGSTTTAVGRASSRPRPTHASRWPAHACRSGTRSSRRCRTMARPSGSAATERPSTLSVSLACSRQRPLRTARMPGRSRSSTSALSTW